MESWVYIFSQFTPEALVLELAAIFILCGGYAVFWILRKRRYGVVEKELPAGPVKDYLNELIGTADGLKKQLFGILSSEEGGTNDVASGSLDKNSDLSKILGTLESKLDAQGKAIENLVAHGVPMSANLSGQAIPAGSQEAAAAAPAGSAAAPTDAPAAAGGAVDGAEVNSLKEKVNNLEVRLAEYSIIEDDLANLKRIQQENAELRAALAAAGKGGAAPAPEAPAVAAPAPAPVAEPKVEVPVPAPVAAAAPPVPEPAVAAPEVKPPAAVEQPAAPRAPAEMGEDDLVKEFEKMLQG